MSRKFCLVVGLFTCFAVAGCSGESGQENKVPAFEQASTTSSPGQGGAPAAGQPRCWLDKLDDESVPRGGSGVVFPEGPSFDVAGWMVDGDHRAVDGVQLVLTPVAGGTALRFPAVTGVERTDVAQALHSAAATSAGFTVHGDLESLAAGRYEASVEATSGGAIERCDLHVTLSVVKAG